MGSACPQDWSPLSSSVGVGDMDAAPPVWWPLTSRPHKLLLKHLDFHGSQGIISGGTLNKCQRLLCAVLAAGSLEGPEGRCGASGGGRAPPPAKRAAFPTKLAFVTLQHQARWRL